MAFGTLVDSNVLLDVITDDSDSHRRQLVPWRALPSAGRSTSTL